MADNDRGAELPRRIRGAAWAGPVPPVALVALSRELRQHMQAAVEAERAAAGRAATVPGRVLPPESAVSGETDPEETSFPANGTSRRRNGAAAAGPAVKPRKPRRRTRARLIALGLGVIVTGSLAAIAGDHVALSSPDVRAQASAWVAEQVSPDVTVSCDAVMCAALQNHGFPASKLVVFGPTTPDPLSSAVVVETAAVHALFGSSLAMTWAPAVLASFGSGPGAITIRVVAPHGGAAYRAALRADLSGRVTSGAALLHDSQVTVSAVARSQLLAGQVDPRLLLALASLAGHEPIDIVRFGNPGPGASPGVLLRFADLAEDIPAARMDAAAYARALWAVLNGTSGQIRPARAVSGPVQGQAILRVEFSAPSPPGTLAADPPADR
ncbi:MAG TPA: hypothetical protein VMK84_21205 [Streptosporangiaceae bacterium]|nr:hypothetical protein [Streptosporangiaceae bacterium]